ncbi:UDP glycosyltransferase 9-like [Ipomoea triloba]|uniref:UDP glycosyltransferase 9-like n=1 Tax=Ipomoea triloba TaxID=35885 RepID=UPI00125E54B8|nr:UDP glycosyltransferase 9-like [Ipomoea triloba]
MDMEMPDVIAVPYPFQGHINPMLQFCSSLSARGVRVTLVLTHGVAKSMPQSTLSQPFHTVECISDGTDIATSPRNLEENSRFPGAVFEGVAAIIQNQKKASGGAATKVLVHDAMMPWLLEVGRAGGLRVASLFTQPASLCAIYYHMLRGHVVQELTASCWRISCIMKKRRKWHQSYFIAYISPSPLLVIYTVFFFIFLHSVIFPTHQYNSFYFSFSIAILLTNPTWYQS